jgi:hypothetical protein
MALVLVGVAGAADHPGRTKLIGSWETAGGPQIAETWTLAADGEAMNIRRTKAGEVASELKCNTLGTECRLKEAGKPLHVSMWFNGAKLVVMETRGTEVLKRRFQAGEDGRTLEMEVIPIVPQGKTETIRLARAAESQ